MTFRSIAVVIFALSMSSTLAFPQSKAKEHYVKGDQLLKESQLFEAVSELSQAAKLEPRNKKYERRLSEATRAASVLAETRGEAFLLKSGGGDIAQARYWLKRALEYDSFNMSAKRSSEKLEEDIEAAKARATDARAALDRADVESAESSVKSLQPFREVVSDVPRLEKELAACKQASAAKRLWDNGGNTKALSQLVSAESAAPGSRCVRSFSLSLRRSVSAYYLTAASRLSGRSVAAMLERVHLMDSALNADPSNNDAARLFEQSASAWSNLALAESKALNGGTDIRRARVSLETLRLAERELSQNPSFISAQNSLKASSYPPLRVHVSTVRPSNCASVVTQDWVRATLEEALRPVAFIEDEAGGHVLSVRELTCSTTDIPRQSSQKVNSTYVAGHNQLVNPEYTRLEAQLAYAQQQLNQANINNQLNPSFGTSFAVGLWQGRVARLQRELNGTPPYIIQGVVQQYQYERFQAYRSYQLSCILGFYSQGDANKSILQRDIIAKAEDVKEGTTGVLAEDSTGAEDSEPVLMSSESLAAQAVERFRDNLREGSKQLVWSYLGTRVMDKNVDSTTRLADLLYALDVAKGTKYQDLGHQYSTNLHTMLVNGLSDMSQTKSILDSLSIPIPDRPQASEYEPEATVQPATSLEKALQGVVMVETDNGTGSGFFLTPACVVITNQHVIAGADTIILRTTSRRLFTATVVAQDEDRDLALMKSNAPSCSPLSLGDSSRAAIGQDVYAIGSPLGLSDTVTRGIISALRTSGKGIHYLQVDATINPGNSGGPLIDRNGDVLGVTTFKVRGFEGLNFAIASSEIKSAFGRYLR